MNILKSNKVRESVSDCSHDIWSHWMEYLFTKCEVNPNGSYTIPKELVERWERQVKTKYKYLSEKEKDSDREQADKIIDVILKLEF